MGVSCLVTSSRWAKRALFVATLLLCWVVAAPAYARELTSRPDLPLASSALTPPMTPATPTPKRDAEASARAPQCDIRCATTFAPVPQLQDEEVSLALTEDSPGAGPQFDATRMVPGEEQAAAASHDEPCTVAAQSVLPARPAGLLGPVGARGARGPGGVRSALERPPR